jgi:hypothetical protein
MGLFIAGFLLGILMVFAFAAWVSREDKDDGRKD